MTRPAYYLANLYDVDVAKGDDGTDRRSTLGVVKAAMSPHDFGTFLTSVGGLPQSSDFWAAPELAPALILLPSRPPKHPETDAQVAADAMLTGLEQTLGSGRQILTQDLVLRLVELTRSVAERAADIGLIARSDP